MTADTLPTAGASSPFARGRDLILPLALVASVLVIIVPMPPALMDILLSANIALAVIILLTTVYVRTPLEFSIFPSLLLATTLARLVLNVATTRLILTRAPLEGPLAAGHVVQAFGDFVAGNQLVVGLILFALIVIIQFVVITKGATRISEVAARFALDGMPGRQMAIDADLNAGIIHEAEAQRRRQEISRQADFYGAMDGASKFVRGDAVAGILIVLVNIVGGLVIGMAQGGMSFARAAEVFTRLTIGDGLVTQVPAFLISLAAGLLVTRSNTPTNLPREFLQQLFSRPQALAVAGGFLGILIFTKLPAAPLMLIGGSCLGMAVMLSRQTQREAAAVAARAKDEAKKKPEERIESFLTTDPMDLEIGVGLVRLADPKRGGDLLERIQRVRQSVASDLGIVMPKVRIRDNLRLQQTAYRLKIAEIPVAQGTLEPAMLLAVDSPATTARLHGIETRDPAGRAATWIDLAQRDQAERYGYTVMEPAAVLVMHLAETVRKHADELLTRDAAKHLIEELRKTAPAVVDELIPGQMKLAEVQRVLQTLLREQVSIRHLGPILETLGDEAAHTKDPVVLAQYVRGRLARAICARYRSPDGKLYVVTLDPALEERIEAALDRRDRAAVSRMPPQETEDIGRLLGDALKVLEADGRPPVALVSPPIRAGLKQMTAGLLPRLVVLSYDEISRDTQVESVAMVGQPQHQAVPA